MEDERLRRSGNGHEARPCMVGLKSQKEGPEKPLCAAVELKPRFQSWRLQMLEMSVPCNIDQGDLRQWNVGNLGEKSLRA